MIDGLVAGRIFGESAQRVDKAGKAFTVAKVRATTADGELLFSTNLRSFRLDAALAADPRCVEITRQTLPEDFRDRRIHRSFRIVN